MIKTISVINHIGVRTNIPLNDPDPTGVIIQNVSGLGAEDGIVNISEFANLDGGILSSSRLPSREIAFTFGITSTVTTVEETRLNLYKWFPIKKAVRLIIETDIRTYYIDGVVKKNSPDIFSDDETTQIVISCPNPYFREVKTEKEKQQSTIYKAEPLFEFPFSNESLDENLIELSRINDTAFLTFLNPGADDVGALFTFRFYGPVKNPSIVNETTNSIFYIESSILEELYGTGFKNGDVAEISSIAGKHYAILYRNGKRYNLLNAVRRDSKWITFVRGENKIYYFADSFSENADLSIDVDYIYEGI